MSFTQNLLLNTPPPGDPAQFNNWGTMENTGRTLVDSAVAGVLPLSVTGGTTVLTSNQGAPDQARNAHYNCTGILTANQVLLWPQGCGRAFSVSNNCTGAFTLTLAANNGSGAPAGTTVIVPQGYSVNVISDGTNVKIRQNFFDTPVAIPNGLSIGGQPLGSNALAIFGSVSVNGPITTAGAVGAGSNGIGTSLLAASGDGVSAGTLTCRGFGNTGIYGTQGLSTDDGNGIKMICVANGVILNNSASAWAAISDYRAKNVVGAYTDSGRIIDCVPVYLASLKSAPENVKAMFLAHEVQSAVPYAVHGEKDGVDGEGRAIMQTVETTDPLVPILWAEVRSLRARLAVLEARP